MPITEHISNNELSEQLLKDFKGSCENVNEWNKSQFFEKLLECQDDLPDDLQDEDLDEIAGFMEDIVLNEFETGLGTDYL